jgi:glycosyltransferase involved in cell wall biosynthesis
MRVSVIVSTRNRGHSIVACLQSIVHSIVKAGVTNAEIVVVDNGSTDDTCAVVTAWAAGVRDVAVQLVHEPRPGLSRAHNAGLRAARGALLCFTDDDCRYHPDYIADLLRHDAADTGLVLRGGRIELGDAADLPITINTSDEPRQSSLADGSARHHALCGYIHGCNMTFRRALLDRIGGFDEDFGRGGVINSGNDTDLIYRAYLAGATIAYVPDMAVYHFHGRRTAAQGWSIFRTYMIANGALAMRYGFKDPRLCMPLLWDLKNAMHELLTGRNTFMPSVGFSHCDKCRYSLRGAFRYLRTRRPLQALLAG